MNAELKKDYLEIIERILKTDLKNFQIETVNQVYKQLSDSSNSQNRVLVADEVGLGKTLVAKGVIAKFARDYINNDKRNPFKIIYICSNQSIAKQNLRKLDIFGVNENSEKNSRLSMQHLSQRIKEREGKEEDNYFQIIPMTPGTSFSMTNGGGSFSERALIYAVLSRIPPLNTKGNREQLSEFLRHTATTSWNGEKERYCGLVIEEERLSNGSYPKQLIDKILKYNFDTSNKSVVDYLINYFKILKQDADTKEIQTKGNVINKLRMMFAELSIEELNPDLVIMDEFQKFDFMLQTEEQFDKLKSSSETEFQRKVQTKIVNKFLKSNPKLLLLSATPFRMFSTSAESNLDGSYNSDFTKITDFLFEKNENRNKLFKKEWQQYQITLNSELKSNNPDFSKVIKAKRIAQEILFNGICRTERISDKGTVELINSWKSKGYSITDFDIKSYQEAYEVFLETKSNLIEYSKSCPYLLSFMRDYVEKQELENALDLDNTLFNKLENKPHLWLNYQSINNYEEILHSTHSRLNVLKEEIFHRPNDCNYLWVPPSIPYYDFGGAYKSNIVPEGKNKNEEYFSKILVFSAWEMVPRMIGNLISYEEERLTDGVMKGKKIPYFVPKDSSTKTRLPSNRLKSVSKNKSNTLLTLMYPSKYLASLFNGVDCLNSENQEFYFSRILEELDKQIDIIQKQYEEKSKNEDPNWYYMLPIFLERDYAKSWQNKVTKIKLSDNSSENETDFDDQNLLDFIEKMDLSESRKLGTMPEKEKLKKVLFDMVLGSPAVCLYRAGITDFELNIRLSKEFIKLFNTTESTCIIELSEGNKEDGESSEEEKTEKYWRQVLQYCKHGNFQAMLDEYIHLITEGQGISDTRVDEEYPLWFTTFIDAVSMKTSSYSVDTLESIREKHKIQGPIPSDFCGKRMRAHYAVGFINGQKEDEKSVNRKESIRNAFNSPFWPFVLATTSVGQEGLDFHYYCRKIMHWNLPSNPVDLEQREGRVNRFKCHAVRQNLAKRFIDNEIKNIPDIYKNNFWKYIFKEADTNKDGSVLVPYWGLSRELLPENYINIERIVPMYPVSKDEMKYSKLLKVLSVYRSTLGQPHQEELVNNILNVLENKDYTEEDIKKLFIDLCPYNHK